MTDDMNCMCCGKDVYSLLNESMVLLKWDTENQINVLLGSFCSTDCCSTWLNMNMAE